ncbi:MAG: acetyl-CoA carboxylase biotin carboxylase subunit [Bryobacteraceae bacterium]
MGLFHKVLVANRGEIAVRVIRALREASIRSVAVYSDADRGALHVQMADEAAHLGPAPSAESYLRIDKILAAAKRHGADAIHPGYGFLSENADFARACEESGVIFIGPSAESIGRLGSKTGARQIARDAGVPTIPGTSGAVTDPAIARSIAREIGYPVIIKAAAGGGGKGMRLVEDEAGLEAALRDASSEAERAFNSSEVYIEKFVVAPRHIEIQVLGDRHGRMIHLGERECSIQRRHQKVIEECPSPVMSIDPGLRDRMGEAAVRVAQAAGYFNAGTVEFLVDAERNFYFLEMNTRLQVEHPVTELVTSLDLVHWQLRIAAGERLTVEQSQVQWRGAALECRIYAEDPDNQFFPSPGKITAMRVPSGPGIRLDSGVYPGWNVPIDYDPLLAKLAVWADTRAGAIARMLRALDELSVFGIRTNIAFFRRILRDPEFVAGNLHTGFIQEFLNRPTEERPADRGPEQVALLIGLQSQWNATARPMEPQSKWREGRRELLRTTDR